MTVFGALPTTGGRTFTVLPPAVRRAVAALRWVALVCALLTLRTAWAQAGGPATSVSPPTATSGWAALAGFVTEPGITVLLLVAGCLLLFHDLLTPFTWGATGTFGVALMGLVFAANVTERSHGWIGVILLLLGLTLILAEIHVYPGHGMAAIGGLLILFLGMFIALGGMREIAFSLPVSGMLTIVAMVSFFAYLPKSKVWKQIGRELRQRSAIACGSGDTQSSLVGAQGVVLSALRPTGEAMIHGMKVRVVTEGDFLDVGASVTVMSIDGQRIVVESADAVASAEQELQSR